MSHQRRFGNDGPPSTWPCKPKNRSDDMNEKDEDIAHGGIVSDLESRLFSGIGNSPSTAVIGVGWRFEERLHDSEDSSKLNTSFIERLNLTIRQGSAYLFRRTICHARWKERLEDQLELLRCHYNFVRPHRALKFGREVRTPAVQAGLTKRRLTLRRIFSSRMVFLTSDRSCSSPPLSRSFSMIR